MKTRPSKSSALWAAGTTANERRINGASPYLSRHRGSASLGIALWISCACFAGCRDSKPPTGNVSGRITFQAAPVTAGTVIFENPSEAWIVATELGGDGRYRLSEVRVGEYTVSVQPPPQKTPNESDATPEEIKASLARKSPDPANIPRAVRSTQTSTLRARVEPGENELEFDLAKTER